MIVRVIVLLAAVACFAQESPWIIIATDGSRKAEIRIGQSPGDSLTTFTADIGKDFVAYRVRAWKQGDQMHFTVAGLKTKPGVIWDRHSFDQLSEVSIGSGQVSPEHPVTTVAPLDFRLEKVKTGCGVTVPEIGNLTTALQLDQIEYKAHNCWLVVRNISAKNIVGVNLGRKDPDGKFQSSGGSYSRTRDPAHRVLIAPGATFRQQTGVGRLAGESINLNHDGQLYLASVVFDDETWDGDATSAIHAIAQDAAHIAQTVRFAKAIAHALDIPDTETTGIEQLRTAIKQIPPRDEQLEEKLTTRYGEKYADILRSAVHVEMQMTPQTLSRYVDDFEQWKIRSPNGSFRQYWSNVLQVCEMTVGETIRPSHLGSAKVTTLDPAPIVTNCRPSIS